jgi:SNF2 family DNA or RNA helicase
VKKVIQPSGQALKNLAASAYTHPEWQKLSIEAHRVSLQQHIDQLLGLAELDRQNIQILPHQVNAVMTVINKMRTRAILADEVGLGKTIEAGLIIKEYLSRGIVKKVLVLTPAPLTTQWRGEMLHKFGEFFMVADKEDEPFFLGFDQHPLLIVSLDTAKHASNAEMILNQQWDMVVIDEAHRLKNAMTQAYKFVAQLRTRFMLLLTATPIQNSLFELYNLVNLLQEGTLGTPEHFKANYIEDKNARVLKNADSLSNILQKVMVRHRRSDVGIKFPARNVETVLLEGTPEELDLHQEMLNFVRAGREVGDNLKGPNTLTYIRLSRMMASSPAALQSTLKGLIANTEDPLELDGLRRIYEKCLLIDQNSKVQALLSSLAEVKSQAIVFTSFYETQRYVKEQLEKSGYSVILFSGAMSKKEKDEAVQKFKAGEAQIFLCTDAGSEGVNLQFCHVLVNYDLPWNPMRVEQRIGRVHRIGQKRDVIILNMAIRDTVEEYILQLLEQKIALFTNAVGETDLILSNLRGHESFEKAVIDIIAATKEPQELKYQFEAFGEALLMAKEAADQIKSFDEKTLALLDLSVLEKATI